MPRPRLIIAACLIAATTVVLAACGDTEEKNDYVDAVNNVTSTLNTGLGDVSSQANQVDAPDQVATVFTDFAAQLETATTELDEITPPDEVSELHDQLVGELQELTDSANAAAEGIEGGGAAALVTTAQEFIAEATRISTEADATITEINNELQN
jgi:hypothetical protein